MLREKTLKRIAGLIFTTLLFASDARSEIILLPLDPPIPGQAPGSPPLPQLVFDRTLDFRQSFPVSGVTGYIDVSRIGDFNNPTTTRGTNGAPSEGISILGLSQTNPGFEYEWVFWPGIAGTANETTDVPANRQHLLNVPFSQNELIDCIDESGFARVKLKSGNDVDNAPYAAAVFKVDVFSVPEPSSLILSLAVSLTIVAGRFFRSRYRYPRTT